MHAQNRIHSHCNKFQSQLNMLQVKQLIISMHTPSMKLEARSASLSHTSQQKKNSKKPMWVTSVSIAKTSCIQLSCELKNLSHWVGGDHCVELNKRMMTLTLHNFSYQTSITCSYVLLPVIVLLKLWQSCLLKVSSTSKLVLNQARIYSERNSN